MKQLLIQASPYLLTLVALAITAALTLFSAFLFERFKDSKLWSFMAYALETSKLAVQHVEANLKPLLASASADGVLTKEERHQLQQAAIKIMLEFGGQRLISGAKKHFPGLDDTRLNEWLKSLIERAVATMPNKVLAAAVTSPPVAMSFATPGGSVDAKSIAEAVRKELGVEKTATEDMEPPKRDIPF